MRPISRVMRTTRAVRATRTAKPQRASARAAARPPMPLPATRIVLFGEAAAPMLVGAMRVTLRRPAPKPTEYPSGRAKAVSVEADISVEPLFAPEPEHLLYRAVGEAKDDRVLARCEAEGVPRRHDEDVAFAELEYRFLAGAADRRAAAAFEADVDARVAAAVGPRRKSGRQALRERAHRRHRRMAGRGVDEAQFEAVVRVDRALRDA